MDIYPQDLGEELESQVRDVPVLRRRASIPPVHPWIVGIWFLIGVGCTVWLGLSNSFIAIITASVSLGLLICYFDRCLQWNSKDTPEAIAATAEPYFQNPLTLDEIEDLHWSETEPLLKQYLNLVRDIMTTEFEPDADADRELRTALKVLGHTVHELPASELGAGLDDPAALRTKASELLIEADREADAAIFASLHRRSESLLHRADTAAHTRLLVRRNQALRQETAEQINALQTSLTAFTVGGRQSAPELSSLAASIQRVAQEASAITEARAEVDTLIVEPYRTNAPAGDELKQRILDGQ